MLDKDIQQLKLLKAKLNNREMSVLIGAGFSKNVSDIFPTWWQLLFDMTYFLFETEVEEALSLVKKSKSTFKKEEFINDKISNYISKIGYLDIVSEFIKRKGYREAITSYIEEKTPKITESGNNKYLENKVGGKNNKVKIQAKMLSQHKLLLDLPWNNIYTTNYDELLEHSNDSTTSKGISLEIEIIENEMLSLQGEKSEIQIKNKELKNKIESLTSRIEELKKNEIHNNAEIRKLEDEEQKKQIEYRKKEFELQGINRRITDKERDLLQLKKALNECITLVKNSEDLSIKRNKNIIKLHGSLRSNESRYGFDGDIQKQYVIAREDYESYPEKHEAFTQLMRISLLQESYCLIGFSGDDTNFLEWIKWVREILARGNNRADYKIYLIIVNNSPISEDKLLFFENHKVYPITVMTDKVIDFMEREASIKLENRSHKSVIELFFKYLKGKHQVNISKTIFEILQVNKYKRSWDSIPSFEPKKIEYAEIDSLSRTLLELKKYYRLPSLNFAYSNIKHSLLSYSRALIDTAPKKHKAALLRLVILAIRDSYLTIKDFVWDETALKKIENLVNQSTKTVQKEFALLMLRDCALRRDVNTFQGIESKFTSKSDNIIYEYLLITAFNLDFKTLKVILKSWNPKSDWVIKKTGLLALFDSSTAIELISGQLGNTSNTSQEESYRLEMYRYVKQSVDFRFDKDLNEAINTYKQLGLTPISENLDYLIEEANKNKIKRYGEGRFNISNEFNFSNDFISPQKGLQFLQQMIETGFPLSITNINWKNPKDCYPLFKEIFQYFPYPTIFYVLQFSDEKFLRRLGQDFAYSESLKSSLDEILTTLLKAYLDDDTPDRFKQSILYFSSELSITSGPSTWQNLFLKIWNTETFRTRCLDDRWFAERALTVSCLPYIQDPKIITELISSILVNPDSNYSVELLYYLAKNNRLEELGENLQSQELQETIELIIESIHKNETSIFIVGNLYSILTTSQKDITCEKLLDIDFNKIENERVWRILIYLSGGDQKIIDRLKSAVIKNKKLFNAGFTDKGLSMRIDFIDVSRLTNSRNSKYIKWTKAEAKKIFRKVVLELKKMEDWLDTRKHNFTFILHEMLLFLEKEKLKIESEKEYKPVLERIRQLYNEHRGYETLIDGLVSTDSSVVVWALSELSIFLYQKKSLKEHEFEVVALLNKLLLQSDPSLEASLNYLAAWIKNDELSEHFRKHATIILSILKKYTAKELEEFDKPFVYQQLIEIAHVLTSWEIQDDTIDHWMNFERETAFNNIKFRKSE